MTYVFGRMLGLDQKVGNPSVSEKVSSYMVSLCCRKVQAGETATSARAITPEIMERLYDFNHQPENWTVPPQWEPGTCQPPITVSASESAPRPQPCGSPLHRRVLQAVYTIAFLCLLCIDEVLKIWVEHIEWVGAGGCTQAADAAMTPEQFLLMFCLNMCEVGIDPTPYGTHSFRRGGCQYLASQRRWLICRICEWGGWSTEFSSMTIVKYLISWNDDPTEA
ncbi:hypothetical protein BYT27DRAFT_7222995 [Phlegmacium glaucopus]|nr:hypothetical protein BYT27DRAFT_7222995 [Phlegmacium glaucopus]